MFKIGIIREGKIPPDARVALTPEQCIQAQQSLPVRIVVQPSPIRCYQDNEYIQMGVTMQEDLSDCDVLIGVKEVPVDKLMDDKTYLFFSHTIKKQAYNRHLLQTIIQRRIRMIDYEALTNERGERLIAFGFYAGIVGAHNGIWAYGQRTGLFDLPRLCQSHDYAEVLEVYKKTQLPPIRIVLTGGGRVAAGAVKNLLDMGIRQVTPAEFLEQDFPEAVFTQIHAADYAVHKAGKEFSKSDFYANGQDYASVFAPFAHRADVFINGIFYDKKAPRFFSVQDMQHPDFSIKTIADVTCDIMPDSSVPSTVQPSKIADPVYGFNPATGEACAPWQNDCVDVMAIDNLPSELPRDASEFFGQQLIDRILPELVKGRQSDVIRRGMITENGDLTPEFEYLRDFVNG